MNIIEELKRRKVFTTLGVYAAAAFIIIQVAEIVFPRFLFPDWTVTFVIILVILGFPVTFFLSWTYDLKRANETDDQSKHADVITDKKWSLTKKIILPITGFVLMAIGGAFWFIYPFLTISLGEDREYDASIAILYMDNISPEEKSYFADGLTEELITRLSRIQNLKVRPRTDVAAFKNKASTMDEIATQLNVNYVVEGSVQIVDDDLRVNVALFDIDKDNTIWSETYNNRLEDILNVQDEIANSIVSKLDEKLTITRSDLQATERKATENLEAYNLIMQAYAYINNPKYSSTMSGEKAEALAAEALKLDSTYADAYAISSLTKIMKWIDIPPYDDPEIEKKRVIDVNKANLLAKTALQYDQDNLLAHTILILLPLFYQEAEEFEANQLLIYRSMLIDAKILLQKYPDTLISEWLYAFILLQKCNLQGGDKEDYKEPLEKMLTVYKKLERKNFVISHPTEGIVISTIWGNIAKLYGLIGEPEKGMDFIIENKQLICPNGTYECLNVDVLRQIMRGFYHAYYYEKALEIIDMVLSQNEEDLKSSGFSMDDKKQIYFQYGMIYMKWGQYDKAIEGFNQALNLTFENKTTNQWWNAQFYRRLGLIYFLKGDYITSSKHFKEAVRLNKTIDDEKESIKSLCFYGYVEQLIGNHEKAKEAMAECATFISKKPLKEGTDFPGSEIYETTWTLYLYHNSLNNLEEASKHLTLAYESIEKESIDEYHNHKEKDAHPKFFYCRDIIKTYETSLNQ